MIAGVSGRLRAAAGTSARESLPRLVAFAGAAAIIAIAALLVYELWDKSAAARHTFGWRFLITQTWDPVAGAFGALPFIYGTVVTSGVALLIGVPLGLGTAIFLAEMTPPRASAALTFFIELLAAVPSVIFGLLGIFVLIPFLQAHVVPPIKAVTGLLPLFSGPFYGVSLLSASIVLAIMIVPLIISMSREVLLAVPREMREAALALGSTKWEATWHVLMPCARTGIAGSILLALARALGETMAVTMVIGNAPRTPVSLLAPGYSIAAVIANEFTEATGSLYPSALMELGLVLFAITVVINGIARLLIRATRGGSRT